LTISISRDNERQKQRVDAVAALAVKASRGFQLHVVVFRSIFL